MAGGWTNAETKALIDLWGEQNVQEQLDNVRRNKDVYEKIARGMAEQGYNKSWKQCRVKVKNLTQRYRKVMPLEAVSLLYLVFNSFGTGERWQQHQWAI